MSFNLDNGIRNPTRAALILGVDFDNTLACYSDLFYTLALERGLIDQAVARDKRSVRDALRRRGLEQEWTELQGLAYGQRLLAAPPFPAAIETLRVLHRAGISLRVVSHKTCFPARGPRYDLRAAALEWLSHYGVLDPARTGIGREQIFFENSQRAKCQRVRALHCTHFVDDLREFLLHPEFPPGVQRLLFDPSGEGMGRRSVRVVTDWNQVAEYFIGPRGRQPGDAFFGRAYGAI